VNGKTTVVAKEKIERIITGRLGQLVFKKNLRVLMEKISAISVKILSTNQSVCNVGSFILWKMPKKIKSKTVLTKANNTINKIT
jgi:hypothetical protein